jgi:two-component system OmpR family sensor kinase
VDGDRVSINLAGDLGRYRLISQSRDYGMVVVGLPLKDVDTFLVELIGLEAVLAALAVVGAVIAARAVVARSLRPLNRVAATAQQVSQLDLHQGEVDLDVRVPAADADPSSEVGRVGQALNHMLNNVEEALAARHASETKVRQFVADASHELRNPLAAIRGYAELTRREREKIPTDAAYAMSRVESEAERMSHLVEDLLLLARLDSGPDLEIKPVDLTEIVINAVSDARAAGPDHTWTLAVPDEPVSAVGDRHRLHQVVANLLANARTHTPTGTRVETGIAVRDDQVVLTVVDDGPGIPAGIKDQVFERFTRAEVSRVRTIRGDQGASTGLGLAIVAAVVDAHQGEVSVLSRPGRTEFSVRLPLAASAHTGPGPDMRAPA